MGTLDAEDMAALSRALPDHSHLSIAKSEPSRAWARILARPDVVNRKGKLTLLNSVMGPMDAMVEDLLFVRSALLAAGVEFFLVRGNGENPVIAVDWKARKAVARALALAAANEPFYSKTIEVSAGPALLVADGRLSIDATARVLRLYRARMEPVGGLRFGAAAGVQLELWSLGEDDALLPAENALTRRILPRIELRETTVDRYGVSWRTIEGMFGTLSEDIDFDIDMIFSWVDGADLEFQRARARRMKNYVVGEGDDHAARYRQIDELRYALRSVYLFAPWVRRIFIVTDSPAPAWLDDHPRVRIVRSEEFFANQGDLPTHNSQAVESQLHHIAGLAEHFIYSNDDMFLGRPLRPQMFFSPGGVTKFVEAETRIGLGDPSVERSGFENSARVNRELLRDRFGVTITRHLEHAATPLRKSIVEELEREFPEEFARTAASAFRAADNISVTNSLYHYYALLTGRAVVQENARVQYVDTTTHVGLSTLGTLLRQRSQDFFCLNDGSFPEVSDEERSIAVLAFLDRYFAIPAPWEKPSVATEAALGHD